MKPFSQVDLIVDQLNIDPLRIPGFKPKLAREMVTQSLTRIRLAAIDVTPAKTKSNLWAVNSALRKAQTAIKQLPAHYRNSYPADELQRLIELSSVQARHIKKIGRSGGDRQGAARKLIAAQEAFDLILFAGRIPTLTKPELTKSGASDAGEYLRLSAELYRQSMGQTKKPDLERACRTWFERLAKGDEGDGGPAIWKMPKGTTSRKRKSPANSKK